MAPSAQSSKQGGGGPESVYTSELSLSMGAFVAGTARDVVDAAAAPGAPGRRLEAPSLRAGDTLDKLLLATKSKYEMRCTVFHG